MATVIYDKKIDKYLRKYYIKKQNENVPELFKTFVNDTKEIKNIFVVYCYTMIQYVWKLLLKI